MPSREIERFLPNTFVLEPVRFVFTRGVEEFRRSGPRPVRERLPSGYEYSFYRVLFRGRGGIYTDDFQWIFFPPTYQGNLISTL